jgi:hypothetical protein
MTDNDSILNRAAISYCVLLLVVTVIDGMKCTFSEEGGGGRDSLS